MKNENMNNNLIKKELTSGITVYPILKYLEELFGYKQMIQIIDPLGLTISYLLEKNNWISFEYYNLLLDKLVNVTNDRRAPFKVYLTTDSTNIINDFISVIYPANLFKSTGFGYKFLFNLLIHKWISKISNFKILSFKQNFIKLQFESKNGYKPNKNACLSLKGFLICLANVYGFPSPKIKDINTLFFNKDSCIYKLAWKSNKNWGLLVFPLTILTFMSINIFLVYKNTFNFNKFSFTFLMTVVILFLINKVFDIINNIKNNKIEHDKDQSIFEAIEKIEKEHNNHILKEIELEEKNKYLIIVDHLRKLITNEIYFYPVLFEINKILIREFNFFKGAYFQFDIKDGFFILNFELNNENADNMKDNIKIDVSDMKISFSNYQDIKNLNFPINFEEFCNYIKRDNKKSIKPLINENNIYVYIISIEISDAILGFFILFSYGKSNISEMIINDLFLNIKEQLRIGYQKISTRNVIENILSSIPAYVLIFSIDNYQIRYVNNTFISSFPGIQEKYTKDDIIGRELSTLPLFTQEVNENIKKFIKKSPSEYSIESYEINFGLNIIEYNLFLIPQDKESERLAGIIMNDITEAKYFQQHLLNNEKLIALGRVATGIAHEINNPLYAILANAEEIADYKKINKESKKYAEEIIELVMNVSNIIKDLSIYSKTLRKEESADVDLNAVIEESLKLVKYSSNFLEVKINKKLDKIPTLKLTKGEMQQVFINLFNNAIYAMDGKGELKITSEYKNKNIFISISDTGSGINENDQKHIFDLFFTTKEPGKGTGQGLNIVKRILDKYNAKIEFKSEVNKGTVFYLTFNVKK